MPISAKTYTTEVICLRTIDFSEADKVLHLYSPEYGRISAMAKGVKKPHSKLSGACEVLTVSEVQLSKGKNLDVLCQYQPREVFIGVRSDLLKLAYAMLFAEWVYATATDFDMDSHQTYALLKRALKLLDGMEENEIIPTALDFQISMLHAAGFHPELNECILTGGELELNALYYCFSPQLGGITTPERKKKHQMQTGGLNIQWVNVTGSTLAILTNPYQARWSESQLLKAQKFLQYYFKQVFEKNLHAFDLVFNLLETVLPPTEKEMEKQTGLA